MDYNNLRPSLLKGERILWSWRPAHGLIMLRGDWLLSPYHIFVTFFSLYGLKSANEFDKSGMLIYEAVPILVILAYMIVGRFFVDAWLRKRTEYVLTDKRIFILREGPFRSAKILNISQISEINLSERTDGRGTIRFGRLEPLNKNTLSSYIVVPSLDNPPRFIEIDSARNIFNRIQLLKPATT